MEILRRRMIAAALAAGLGLVACGGSDGDQERAEVKSSGVKVVAEYFADGSRILHLKDDGNYYSDIYSICDGPDLIEQSDWNDGGAGNAIARSVGHHACADGRLDPSDFELAPR